MCNCTQKKSYTGKTCKTCTNCNNCCNCGVSTIKKVIDCDGVHITELPTMDSFQPTRDLLYVWDASEGRSKALTLEEFITYLNSVITVDGDVDLPEGTYGRVVDNTIYIPEIIVDSAGDIVGISEVSYTVPQYLDDLLDVNAPTPSTGDVLSWNGSEWVPYTLPPMPPMPEVEYGLYYIQEEFSAVVTPSAPSDPKMISPSFYLVIPGNPGDKFEVDCLFYCTYPLDGVSDICILDIRYSTTGILIPDATDIIDTKSQQYLASLTTGVGAGNARLQMVTKTIIEFGVGVTEIVLKPKFTQGSGSVFTVLNRILTARKIVQL